MAALHHGNPAPPGEPADLCFLDFVTGEKSESLQPGGIEVKVY